MLIYCAHGGIMILRVETCILVCMPINTSESIFEGIRVSDL